MTAQADAENDGAGEGEAAAGPARSTSARWSRPPAGDARLRPPGADGAHRPAADAGAADGDTGGPSSSGRSSGTCSFHLRQLAKYGFCKEMQAADAGARSRGAQPRFHDVELRAGRRRLQRRRAPPRRVGPRALPHADQRSGSRPARTSRPSGSARPGSATSASRSPPANIERLRDDVQALLAAVPRAGDRGGTRRPRAPAAWSPHAVRLPGPRDAVRVPALLREDVGFRRFWCSPSRVARR